MADNIVITWESQGGDRALSQVTGFSKGLDATAKAAKRLAGESRGLSQLAGALGTTFTEAQKLAKGLGLSGTEAAKAVKSIQQLNAANATTQQRFNALNRELGVNQQQFLALDKAVEQYNNSIEEQIALEQRAKAIRADQQSTIARSTQLAREQAAIGQDNQKNLAAQANAYGRLSVALQGNQGAIDSITKAFGGNAVQAEKAFSSYQKLTQVGTTSANAQRQLNQTLGVTQEQFSELERGANGLTQQVDDLGRAFALAAAAGAGFNFLRAIITSSVEARRELEALRAALANASGGAAQGAVAFDFINQEVDRLSLDITTATRNFTQLSAAAKGTELEGEGVEEIFSAIAQAGRVNNLSLEKQEKAYLAITQAVSKGVVQQEELRGQLSEALPGAVQIFARALGVSTAELQKLIKAGEVGLPELLKFAQQLKEETGAGVANAADTSAASFDRLSTAIFRFQASTGESLEPVTKAVLDFATTTVNEFNKLNPVIKNAILVTSGLGVAYVSLIAALTAIKALGIQQVAIETAQTVARVSATAVTNARAAAELLFARATGTATAQQKAQLATFTQGALKAGIFAAAIAGIGIAISTFQGVNAAADETRQTIEELNNAINAFQEIQASLAETSPEAFETLEEVVKRTQQSISDSLPVIDKALEPLREFLNFGGQGTVTATEVAINNQSLAFNDLIEQIDNDVLAAYDRLKSAPGGLAAANQEELAALAQLLETSQERLDAEATSTNENAISKQNYLRFLQTATGELERFTAANEEAAQATEEQLKAQADALKEAREQESSGIDQQREDAELAADRQREDAALAAGRQRQAEKEARELALQKEITSIQESAQEQQEQRSKAFEESQQQFREQGQRKLQETERAFNEQQQADQEAFERELNEEQRRSQEELNAAQQQIDRQVQLSQARGRERSDLQRQFREQDQEEALRTRLERQSFGGRTLEEEQRNRDEGFEKRREEFEKQQQSAQLKFEEAVLNPLRQELEAQIEQRKLDFETNVLTPLKEQSEARIEALQTEAKLREQELDRQYEDEKRAEDRRLEDEKRTADRAFQEEKRQFDLETARQVKAILETTQISAPTDVSPLLTGGSRFTGGPMVANRPYLVGDGPGGRPTKYSEIVVPNTSSYVIAAKRAQEWLGQAYGTARQIQPNYAAMPNYSAMLTELKLLRKEVRSLPSGEVYQTNHFSAPDAVDEQFWQRQYAVTRIQRRAHR